MYVAIEGIKGSGKSTIINELLNRNTNIAVFPITGGMCKSHPLELQHTLNPNLKSDDSYLEHLFRERAYWNQSVLRKASPLIIGDRSVVTSYVTRWSKWKDPNYTISKVNHDYKGIMKPDVIIWIDSPVELVLNNIKTREEKDLGKRDECYERLCQAKHIYEELFSQKVLLKKCFSSQIIRVDGGHQTSETLAEISAIVRYYHKRGLDK